MAKPANPDKTRRTGERARLRQVAGLAATGKFPQLALGIGDDAALLRVPKGREMVVTTDFCLEGVHFKRAWHSPESAGHRCLARGLSDLAAMGAKPEAAFLSLALPKELSGAWADGFFAGLLALARDHGIPLAGGDLAESPGRARQAKALADIVLVGSVPAGRALLRSSARPGDAVYVTGTLGGAAAELAAVPQRQKSPQHPALGSGPRPHFFPQPRVAAGVALRKLGARIACLDISDGLALDLSRMCEASGVAAEIEAAQLPIAPGSTLQQALTGGEDYEPLFTAPAKLRMPKKLGGVGVTRIGGIKKAKRNQPQLVLLQQDGQREPLAAGGWEYFR